MSKIVSKYWYTTHIGQTIGIIKCYDEITEEVKFYIGVAPGISEESDAEFIQSYGDKFYPEYLDPNF